MATHTVTSRLVALVGALTQERRVAQTDGFPIDPEAMLPVADVVLIVADADGSAMLFRYTAHGEFGGDTWHPSIADAREQAVFEYGTALATWIDVPRDIRDAHGFAIKYAYDQLDKRGGW